MTLKMSVISRAYRDACESLLKNCIFYKALQDEVCECRILPLSSNAEIAPSIASIVDMFSSHSTRDSVDEMIVPQGVNAC